MTAIVSNLALIIMKSPYLCLIETNVGFQVVIIYVAFIIDRFAHEMYILNVSEVQP